MLSWHLAANLDRIGNYRRCMKSKLKEQVSQSDLFVHQRPMRIRLLVSSRLMSIGPYLQPLKEKVSTL